MTRRAARTATHAEDRQARRRSLHLLLARADRGVLTRADAALLRSIIDTELAASDASRRAAGGQQAAVRRLQHRLDAAEQAIVEIEAERDSLARDVTSLHDGLNQAAREAFAERKRHRADIHEADRRLGKAEARAERAEQQVLSQTGTAE
ncbi:hypothetical protein [Streptomyces chattanoogensis]|uniref:hypothetical protein n=1 Tax=Streptomyces chattanoogensis TaxID=66876 RepID=UPI0036AA0B9F